MVGIRGLALDIFESYLSERSQLVKLDKFISCEENVSFGVPQGSVIGPTLFLLYINDLCNLKIPNCKIITYADDTALLISGDTWEKTRKHAESALTIVMNWFRFNLLTVNVEKTKFITFSSKPSSMPDSSYKIFAHTCSPNSNLCNCSPLTRTTSIKYLGIIIDHTMSWKEQIQSTVSRIRKLIFIFKNLRSSLDLNTLKTIYFALAQSILSYCIPVWGGALKTNMLHLERTQRAVLKVIISKPIRFPTAEVFSICKVLSVRKLFILRSTLRFHSQLPFNEEYLNNKRRSNRVCPLRPKRTVMAGRYHFFLMPLLYNKINKTINIYPLTLNKCKIKLTNWLLTLSYDQTENLIK